MDLTHSQNTAEYICSEGFETLLVDLLIEIVSKVASQSIKDLFSLKLCSKELYMVTDNNKVYQQATLDRQGLINFFQNVDFHYVGLRYLKSVADKGFLYAMYAFSIIVFSNHVPAVADNHGQDNLTVALYHFITVRNANATKLCGDKFRNPLPED
ncbi:putative F-box protein [Senna tora]|uniref:Putative F-box protein n=1 Tax=Senna tora TaxID=362788 RepID=A0A835C4W3_9FABA|nr:putative F-box protein [Senna tora]